MSNEKYKAADLGRLKLKSVGHRPHLVDVSKFARLPQRGASMAEWLDALPGFLGADRLHGAAETIVAARKAGRAVVMAMGAHVIKVGCGPIVIDLMRRGIVTAIACNGATAIHDVEAAMLGATSEDVAESIRDGSFGMVRETMDFFAEAVRRGSRDDVGLGRAVGDLIRERKMPHEAISVFAAAAELGIPASVHVAVGTDTVHMGPDMDGAALGQASMIDFRRLCSVASDLGAAKPGQPGGIWCNIGSAVVMPEVFLKAVSVARNLGANLDAMSTLNMDMLRHYRPAQNVLMRPVIAGKRFELVGHHEIMLPLLRQAIIERMDA